MPPLFPAGLKRIEAHPWLLSITKLEFGNFYGLAGNVESPPPCLTLLASNEE